MRIAYATGPPKKEARAETRRATSKSSSSARTLSHQAPNDKPLADPLEVFRARCETRAMLYASGEIDLHSAVDVLQDGAIKLGLIESIGQDAVQAIMAEMFERFSHNKKTCREGSLPIAGNLSTVDKSKHVAKSTLDAADWLVRWSHDPKRFEAWLIEHSARERAAIVAHINDKWGKP